MNLSETDKKDISDAAALAIHGGLTNNLDIITGALTVLERYGATGIFVACFGWARMAASVAGLDPEDKDSFIGFGIETVNSDGITRVNPDDVPPEMRPTVWAIRFVTAAANQDFAQCSSLFHAPADDEISDCVSSLLELTVKYFEQSGNTMLN